MSRRSTELVDLEERIVAAEAKAAHACRNHDSVAEWEAECEWWALIDQRDQLIAPEQRRPVE